MLYTFKELRCKDVVNLCDGKFLGHVSDIELDGDCGRMTAIYIGISGGFLQTDKEEVRIPWENIRCVGEDAILVEFKREYDCGCHRAKKNSWWSL